MTTSSDPQTESVEEQAVAPRGGFERREMTAAERELQDVLATARAFGLESETSDAEEDVDVTAATALVELGLDQPIEEEPTPIADFLRGEEEAPEPEPVVSLEGIQESDAAWFAINTYTGHENKVRENLDMRIRNMDVADLFVALNPEQAKQAKPKKSKSQDGPQYVLVPTQQEVEIRGGKRKDVERMLLPGYVLLQIRLNEAGELPDESWHVVSGTTGVTGFVGTRDEQRDRALPLPTEQVAKIIGQTQVEEPQIRVGFAVGDSVRLTDGPFVDMVAEVEEINLDKGKVRVRISMFGRDTPLELDFDQVEKQ